ncbi:MAG: hypothetical protein ACP5LW_05510, partial [Nitrososphaeria archaeon]
PWAHGPQIASRLLYIQQKFPLLSDYPGLYASGAEELLPSARRQIKEKIRKDKESFRGFRRR